MTIQKEGPQEKRLGKFDLTMITSFWDEHAVRRRASDGSVREDIINGVIMDKKYYRKGKLIHTEKMFNPLMRYSFVMGGKLEEDTQCPNCGWRGKTSAFLNGCPYCGASCHISYQDRQEGVKSFAEKKAKQPELYVGSFFGCMGICIGISLLIVLTTGRTHGLFDFLKGIAFGAAPGLIAFCRVYLKRVLEITQEAEAYFRQQSSMLQTFETGLTKKGISLDAFFTSLNTEITTRLFGDAPENGNIVDWDILDYDDCRTERTGEGGEEMVIRMTMRILRMEGNRLRARETESRAVMKTNPVTPDPLRKGAMVVHCHACGSSIDLSQPVCGFCGTPIRYRQPLYLTDLHFGGKAS